MFQTYSVIIQNQKTMDVFARFQPLFMDALNSGEVGVCKWIESGTTLDTALPELGGLTDDKPEWRAIIVRYEDEAPMAAFETDERNPYDFLVNQDAGDEVEESSVPLIRLTQLLGGIPPIEVRFEPQVVQEPHQAPRTIYVPVDNSEQKAKWRSLVDKYHYDGKLPSAILLITVRSKRYQEVGVDRVWLSHSESSSSEFWKRNRYPSICRFLAYDFDEKGPIQREADDFGFWYSVMLFSMNEWDSGTIQAYRLYTCRPNLDREAMTGSFQELADRLRDARGVIDRSIRRDIESQISEEERLPDYRLEVPVPIKLPKSETYRVKTGLFPLLSRGATADMSIWSRERRQAEDSLAASIRSTGRVLDQRADKVRSMCTFDEDTVTPLNMYQEEDLLRETKEIYSDVIKLQGKLLDESVSEREEIVEKAEKVKKKLVTRVMAEPALLAVGLVAVLTLLAALPEVILAIIKKNTFHPWLFAVIGGAVLAVLAAGVVTLLVQKSKLDAAVEKYNEELSDQFYKLLNSAEDYSDYMSGIASHSRGRSYLNISDRKKHYIDEEHYSKYQHIKSINTLLGKLRGWSRAFCLDVDLSSTRPESHMEIDLTVAPGTNRLYAFDVEKSYPVMVNNSGIKMEAPCCFAGSIEIRREELYDDGE